LWLIVFLVSAVGGEPLTEARETSAMSNTRSVPAYEYLVESMICLKNPGFGRWLALRSSFNFATTVAT
jgi:hypothetical protein